ncbi:MAG: hypothetical protein AAGH45_10660 [Pseudomonadota bacterium]
MAEASEPTKPSDTAQPGDAATLSDTTKPGDTAQPSDTATAGKPWHDALWLRLGAFGLAGFIALAGLPLVLPGEGGSFAAPPFIALGPGCLAGLLILARERVWPALLVGAGLGGTVRALLMVDDPLTEGINTGLGVLAALLVVYAVKRVAGDKAPFGTLARAHAFLFASLSGASLGVVPALFALAFGSGPLIEPMATLFATWGPWFAAHALGLLIVGGGLAGLASSGVTGWRLGLLPGRLELMGMIVFGALLWLLLAGLSGVDLAGKIIAAAPLLLWLTIRASISAGLAVLLAGLVALLHTASPAETIGNRDALQLAFGSLAVSILLCGAGMREFLTRLRAKHDIRLFYG